MSQTITRYLGDHLVDLDPVETVAAITSHYFRQSRTICLAVVFAGNDIANQDILRRVLKFDPKGERTLGNCRIFNLATRGGNSMDDNQGGGDWLSRHVN
ncbi:hypothetical protein F5B22DRAFT_652458 [Xylaria bambusicola]|uniref:uncharacterized protein n=1 Tax=Xylaria bambusicola TaxID=326684 RepID=UPI002008E23E|nr:uncharacterized protein F5B22DRAFT_652458 [Xylaria bambusicola]KAI0503057.1 hypothetical protein F5B22DRAFT_652458 [Xylaria bambusicola]